MSECLKGFKSSDVDNKYHSYCNDQIKSEIDNVKGKM